MLLVVGIAILMNYESDRCVAQKINATSAIVVPLLVLQSVKMTIQSVMMVIAEAGIEVRRQMAGWTLGMIQVFGQRTDL